MVIQLKKITYDPQADAMYISINRGTYDISKEISNGVIVDLDKNGKILGIEILWIKKKVGSKLIKKIISSTSVRKLQRIAK